MANVAHFSSENQQKRPTNLNILPMMMMMMYRRLTLLFLLLTSTAIVAFQPTQRRQRLSSSSSSSLQARRRTMTIVREEQTFFDPFHLSTTAHVESPSIDVSSFQKSDNNKKRSGAAVAAVAGALLPLAMAADKAVAAASAAAPVLEQMTTIKKAIPTPETFQPLCPASDGFYRILQSTTANTIGPESYDEYGPLIASGLLRIRLELCVVESFFNEAVGPFIKQNGISWILPLHETVETFIAGTIFAAAATFILIGSTKIITVIVTYTDLLIGIPFRLFGGFINDRALGKPVTLDIGLGPFKTRLVGPPDDPEEKKVDILKLNPVSLVVIGLSGAVRLTGQAVGLLRQAFDAFDLFVGRYLVIWASGYIILKFVHFKIFPDFP